MGTQYERRFGLGDWVVVDGQIYQVTAYASKPEPKIVFLRSINDVVQVRSESSCEPLPPELCKLINY